VKQSLYSIGLLLLGAVIGGGVIWMQTHGGAASHANAEKAGEQKPAEDEGEGPKVSRDTNGNTIISMTDETQGDLGIKVTRPEAVKLSPEIKGYGHILDPAPLAALMTELATAEAAYTASSNELVRSKTLENKGTASERALQAAEAAAQHDQLAVQSAKDRITISWGNGFADKPNLSGFIQELAALKSEIVRVDLPADVSLAAMPLGARIATMSGQLTEAEFLGIAPATDPQMQGKGFLFLLRPNTLPIAVGASVLGYLKLPGEPVVGVVIPREAVVRNAGAAWVYVLDNGGEAFTRTEIALDHPTDAGWFIGKGVTESNYIVVTAAQQLLSLELKGQNAD
jgi:hypothetical protein